MFIEELAVVSILCGEGMWDKAVIFLASLPLPKSSVRRVCGSK